MEIYKNEKRRKDKANTATVDKVLDPKTLKILDNLKKAQKLFNLQGTFSSGKEANVYTADCSTSLISKFIQKDNEQDESIVPVVLKIYKTSTMLFKDRIRYIIDEKRFSSFCTSNSRKLIKVWAEKEIRNLKRLSKYGILCPKPLYLKRTILIMSMVGDEKPAPRLRDAHVENWQEVYYKCVDIVKRMYQNARLVHADFSEYNLIYHKGEVYVIDVGQSVETCHQNAHSFLATDIRNMNDFFEKRGVVLIKDVDIFEDITNLKVPDYLRNVKLSGDSFIPTRVSEVVNEEDFKNFGISEPEESVLEDSDLSEEGIKGSSSAFENTDSNEIESDLQESYSDDENTNEGSFSTGSESNNKISYSKKTKAHKECTASLDNIDIFIRKISSKNPEISKDEEKEYNKQRKKLVKEMNRERRINRVMKEQDTRIKRLNKRQSKKR